MRLVLNKLYEVLIRRPTKAESATSSQHSRLARFIFQDAHFRRQTPAAPKPSAFLPRPPDLKISALWRDALSEAEIWTAGDLLGATRGKPRARADFDLAAVSEANLTIELDTAPHPRHVNLCGWPIPKDEQKSIALLLCARSTLVVR